MVIRVSVMNSCYQDLLIAFIDGGLVIRQGVPLSPYEPQIPAVPA